MGVGYLSISAVCTAISFVGLHWWVQQLLDELKPDGPIQPNFTYLDGTISLIGLLLRSSTSIFLLVNCIASAYMLLVLCLKTVFFSKLSSSETRKLLERLINYLIYKGTFIPLVIPPSLFQLGLWSTWLVVLCSLKMFQALARDRLERLNASPSTTPWIYFRVYSVLLLALTVDIFWIRLCLMICQTSGTSLSLLLLFEPFSVAFETLQAIMVHGFQLLDIWHHHSPGNSCWISKFVDTSAAGSLAEWKSFLLRNFGFLLDMATLSMALGHYVHTWWLRGLAFHFVDVILFLNIRALLSAIFQRIKGFIKLRMALGSLHAVLPDATNEELKAYDDECAICREPMAKAKRLHCKHLFHLGCLRSWLDQGLNNVYACPTCRKPFLAGRQENRENHHTEVGGDEQLARQLSLGLNAHSAPGQMLHPGLFHSQMQSSLDGGAWRNVGLNTSWGNTWHEQDVDGAGPSTASGSAGLGRVQTMMRHLASVGETYAQSALDDGAWDLWPMHPSQAAPSASDAVGTGHPQGTGGLHIRSGSHHVNSDIANILAMAETVREVLPHVPDDLIFQDLQRTNSATVTVNNLLQM